MDNEDKHDGAGVKIIPPTIPLATILIGVVLDYLWPISYGIQLPAPYQFWIGGVILTGAILILGVWPLLMFYHTGQNPEPWKPTPTILERGPYRATRNPMYLMMVLGCIGFAIILSNAWVLILTPLCAWILHRFAILPEEIYLRERFGTTYEEYLKRVRRWI